MSGGQLVKSRIPSLDGIRALSIGLVLVAHAGLGHIVPGGFGVTVFFFLSGYLITYLLCREHRSSGEIALKKFYLRRVLRLLPALYFLLTANAVLGLLGALPHEMSGAIVVAQYLHLTNYIHIHFGTSGMVPATGALWSLAVEEHFYLLYPLLLIVVLRMASVKSILCLFLVCGMVLVWRLLLAHLLNLGESYTYMATDARIDSILFGCILGLMHSASATGAMENALNASPKIAFGLGIALLLVTFLYRDPQFRETWRYTLQGVALIPMFHCAVRFSHWKIFAPLNGSLLRWVGEISYSLYLVHSVCLFFVKQWFGSSPYYGLLLGVPLCLLAAHLMYVGIEKRFLALRGRLRVV